MEASVNGTMQVLSAAGDALEAVMAEVQSHIREFNKHAGIWQSLKAFAAAVDWRERWIQGLIAFHLVLLLLVVVMRRNQVFQGVAFFGIMAAVYLSERLNSALALRWSSFARQPYFDKNGIFISAIYSVPLLLIMFVILINYLINTSELLIQMKRKQLRYELRQRARGEAQEGGANGGDQQQQPPPGNSDVPSEDKKDQ